MKIEHAQPEAFSKMIAGQASPEEAKSIVRHLLAGCGRCIKRSRVAHEEVKSQVWSYDQAFASLESLLSGTAVEPPQRMAYAAMRH